MHLWTKLLPPECRLPIEQQDPAVGEFLGGEGVGFGLILSEGRRTNDWEKQGKDKEGAHEGNPRGTISAQGRMIFSETGRFFGGSRPPGNTWLGKGSPRRF